MDKDDVVLVAEDMVVEEGEFGGDERQEGFDETSSTRDDEKEEVFDERQIK
jgi:hypothetical protein